MSKVGTTAIIILLFAMTIMPFTPVQEEYFAEPDSSSINVADEVLAGKVLVDEFHTDRASEIWTPANASLFGWLLREHGYNVSTNWNQSLDSGILSNYDILCLFFPQTELTSAEVTAITDFVSDGGGLLLVGVDYRESVTAYTSANMNPVAETYGISFNEDDMLGRSLKSEGDIGEHFITNNVESFTSSNDLLWGCTLDVTSPATTVATMEGEDMLAVHDTGTGRVVAIGAVAPFIQYNTAGNLLVDSMDHYELSLNIIDWLMKAESRDVDLPTRATIKVGNGPDISPAELEDYQMFVGQYHDHTTFSDGQDSALDMTLAMLENNLDFAVMSDHAYENPATNGIFGGMAIKAYETEYGLDFHTTVGAELSSIPHSVGFPLTEQIYTTDTQTAVDAVHAQGGIVSFAHPTIGAKYIPVWENLDTYGYDAFEVNNGGFFHGLGESAYFRPFLGANDMHAARKVGTVMNAVFVENPSSADGKITDSELVDAILDRRVVVLDRVNQLVFGQGIWVDRYLSIWDDANSTIQAAETTISQLEDDDVDVSLARSYLEKAKDALDSWNPARAMKLAENAVSDFMLGIDLTHNPSLGLLEPNSEASLTFDVENRHGYSIELNCTPFITNSYSFDETSYSLTAGASATASVELTGHTEDFGFTRTLLNIKDLNATAKIRPILLEFGGLIENISESIESADEGYELTLHLRISSGDSLMLSSVKLTYDDGSGEDTVEMENLRDAFGRTLGPYPIGTNVTYTITVTDRFGTTYVMGEYIVTIAGAGGEIPVLPIAAAGIGVIALLAIIIVFWKKRT